MREFKNNNQKPVISPQSGRNNLQFPQVNFYPIPPLELGRDSHQHSVISMESISEFASKDEPEEKESPNKILDHFDPTKISLNHKQYSLALKEGEKDEIDQI